MADITFGGLATGLPTDDIISQLMDVERMPIDRLEAKKEAETTRLKAFGQLNSRLEALREAVGDMNLTSEVRTSKISLSSEDAFTAESNGAATGSFDVAVVQLAQVQKSISAGWSSSTDALLGSGTFSVGGETITIDETNNSLQGLASAINAFSETTGVQASIINDGKDSDAYHLVLTGEDASTSFTASSTLEDEGGSPIDFSLEQTRSAQQAVAMVDGIQVVSDSNTVSGVIPGVTLHLNEASTMTSSGTPEEGVDSWNWGDPPQYETTKMEVEPDSEALKEKVQTFVNSYNDVMDWISAGYEEFGASSPTEEELADGEEEWLSSTLRGDSAVNGVKRQLQNLLTTMVDTGGSVTSLGQLGIATQKDGSLELNESTLDNVLESDFDDVVSMLAGNDSADGVMKEFNSTMLDLTSLSSGVYATKRTGYTSAVKQLDDQMLRLESMMDKKETTLRARFSALELLVSDMNSQSNFLTQQMSALSNMKTGSN